MFTIALLICCYVIILLQFGSDIFLIRLEMAEYEAKLFHGHEVIKTAKLKSLLASERARGQI